MDLIHALALFDFGALVTVIFLTGSVYQRIRSLESFAEEFKKITNRCYSHDSQLAVLARTVRELQRDIDALNKRIDRKFNSGH